jgi:hypothetical protein
MHLAIRGLRLILIANTRKNLDKLNFFLANVSQSRVLLRFRRHREAPPILGVKTYEVITSMEHDLVLSFPESHDVSYHEDAFGNVPSLTQAPFQYPAPPALDVPRRESLSFAGESSYTLASAVDFGHVNGPAVVAVAAVANNDAKKEKEESIKINPSEFDPGAAELFKLMKKGTHLVLIEGSLLKSNTFGNGTWIVLDIRIKHKQSPMRFRVADSGQVIVVRTASAPAEAAGFFKVKIVTTDGIQKDDGKEHVSWKNFVVEGDKDPMEINNRTRKAYDAIVKKEKKRLANAKEDKKSRERDPTEEMDEDEENDEENGRVAKPSQRKKGKVDSGLRELAELLQRCRELLLAGKLSREMSDELVKKLQKYGKGDVAYWTQKLNPNEVILPGQVVALIFTSDGLRATLSPPPDQKVFAWTVAADEHGTSYGPQPYQEANPSMIKDLTEAVLVVYMGHALVHVRGNVKAGSTLCGGLPGDGFGVERSHGVREREFGVALTDSDKNENVIAMVWIMQTNARLAEVPGMGDVLVRIADIEAKLSNEEFKGMAIKLDALDERLSVLEERFASIVQGASVAEVTLNQIITVCKDYCEVKEEEKYYVSVSKEASQVKLESAESFVRSLIGWQRKVEECLSSAADVVTLETAKQFLAQAIVKGKEVILIWEEESVVWDLKNKLRSDYSKFNVEYFRNPNSKKGVSFVDSFISQQMIDVDKKKVYSGVEEIDFYGKVTKVEGGAGVGKSTWCKMICHRWAIGKDYEHNDLIVLLQYDDVKSMLEESKKVSEETLICEALFSGNKDACKTFLSWSKRGHVRLLWILDGFDDDELDRIWHIFGRDTKSLIASVRQGTTDFKHDRTLKLSEFSVAECYSFIRMYFEGEKPDLSSVAIYLRDLKTLEYALTLQPFLIAKSWSEWEVLKVWLSYKECQSLVQTIESNTGDMRTPAFLGYLCYAILAKNDGQKNQKISPDLVFVMNVVVKVLVNAGSDFAMIQEKLKVLAWSSGAKEVFSWIETDEKIQKQIMQSGLLVRQGHAEKGMFKWKFNALCDFLIAKYMYDSISPTTANELFSRVNCFVRKEWTVYAGMMLEQELVQTNGKVVGKISLFVKFFLNIRHNIDADAGKSVVQCLDGRDSSLRHFASQLWKMDIDLADHWKSCVARFGDFFLGKRCL